MSPREGGPFFRAGPTEAVVGAGGVGYGLVVPLTTHQALPAPGEECFLFTHYSISETNRILYGFATEEERTIFRALVSIKGVGSATALQILSGVAPRDFAALVERQDYDALKQLKGIGEKTAKRIVLELKGAVGLANADADAGGTGAAPIPGAATDTASAARQALETLGLKPADAAGRVERVRATEPDLDLEETIRRALQ